MTAFSPNSLREGMARMGYGLPFSSRSHLRKVAVARFKADMDAAGLNGSGIPDEYIVTPSISHVPGSVRLLLCSWIPPGIETWTEQRIANTQTDSWESQGVTHNSTYWYFTQKNEVFARTLPIAANGAVDKTKPWGSEQKVFNDYLLGAVKDAKSRNFGSIKYDHFGSPCYFEGKIYIPLEPAEKGNHPALLAIYNEDLSSYAAYPLVFRNPFTGKYEKQGQSGWVAVNPIDRCIYTSMQCDKIAGLGKPGHVVLVYTVEQLASISEGNLAKADFDSWWGELGYLPKPQFLGFFPVSSFKYHYENKWFAKDAIANKNYRSIKYPLDGICGGVFDGQGRLFLSIGEDYSDYYGSSKGRVCSYSGFDGSPLGCRVSGTGCSGWSCEAEGLTMWNGELFLVTLQNGKPDNMNFQVLSPPGFTAWTNH